MPYSTESDVYNWSGLTSGLVNSVTGKSTADVTTLVEDMIAKADNRIDKWVRLPVVHRRERHVADGEKRLFELGPEDTELELFDYNPQQGVTKKNGSGPIFAIYENNYRMKMPYPKDCDECENNHASFGSSNITLSSMANTVASLNVGDYHLNGVLTAATGYIQYPSTPNLNKNINAYDYVTFILQTSNSAITFTFHIRDINGNSNSYEFTLPQADMRFCVSIQIGSFTGSVDWEDTPMYSWRLNFSGGSVDDVVKLDGVAFNVGYVWTYPYGEVIHTETEDITTREGDTGVLGYGNRIYVTYSYNPFLAEYNRDGAYPPNIVSASARLAGAFLWDHLAGYVQADSKMRITGDTLQKIPERDTMEKMKKRLIIEAKEDVSEYGYGFVGGVV